MKARAKVILFSRVTVNKQVHQWPVAVFGNTVAAKTYAAYIKMAHASGDVATATKLDPKTRLNEDGSIIIGVKFSMVSAPYDPTPGDGIDDSDITDETPTE